LKSWEEKQKQHLGGISPTSTETEDVSMALISGILAIFLKDSILELDVFNPGTLNFDVTHIFVFSA
jgi:hypothetical protein